MRHPARRLMIEQGLNGYIEFQIARETNNRVEKRLYEEYTRGYDDGITDSDYNQIGKRHLLHMPIEEMDLSVRSYNCLKRANKNRIEDLQPLNRDEIMKIRNLGRKSAQEIALKLRKLGFYFPSWVAFED